MVPAAGAVVLQPVDDLGDVADGDGLDLGDFRGIEMQESRGRFDEGAAMVVEALKTGFIEGDGKFYKQPRTEIRPRPQHSFDGRIYAVSPGAVAFLAASGAWSVADRQSLIEALRPLRARPGGVLQRVGQTEASVDLARLAGLEPAGVIFAVKHYIITVKHQ